MKDGWLKAAFRDDKMVADLLIRLRQSSSSTSSSSSKLQHQYPPQPLLPPLSWGHKQPRSTPMRKYSSTATRCSPRTPLSWSGGAATASPSDGGYDENSVSCAPSDPLAASRSKNFSQLKEEETELLKERVNLKRELEAIRVNLKEQRNRNDNLKRIKFDLNQQSPEEVWSAKHRSQKETSTAYVHQSILPRHAIEEKHALANSCGIQEVAETNKGGFVLPDLNMPVGEDELSAELW